MWSTDLKFVYIISHTIHSIIIITIYCNNEILSTTLLHKGVSNGVFFFLGKLVGKMEKTRKLVGKMEIM